MAVGLGRNGSPAFGGIPVPTLPQLSVPIVGRWRWDQGVTTDVGVSAWEDLGPNGYTLVQTTGASQPVRTMSGGANGRGYITGDGVNDSMAASGVALERPATTPIYIFALMRREPLYSSGAIMFSAGSTVLEFRETTATEVTMRNTAFANGNVNAPINTWLLAELLFTGSVADMLRVGGVSQTGADAGNADPGTIFGIFARSNTLLPSNVSFSEILILNGIPQELAKVRAYFAAEYAVTV